MYQLFGRMYGTNNFPDSSNMCHESTSVALPEVIGVPVGTVLLEDFDHSRLHLLLRPQRRRPTRRGCCIRFRRAAKRGVPIITFNPLRERGLERFTNPQSPLEMTVAGATEIATQYHQVKAGGDIAAMVGICKAVIAADDAAQAAGAPRILDTAFIEEHTHGFEAFAAFCREQDWAQLERASGLRRAALERAAESTWAPRPSSPITAWA